MPDVTALGDLLSESVVVVETRETEVDESALWPDERAALGDVVAGRWWDWVMGRRCARHALEQLGVDPRPVLSGPKREPLWPGGVVGAITHTEGFVAAAVALASERLGVGVDAEPDAPLPAGVLRRIAGDQEQEWLESGPETGVGHPDRLLFCVKESVYKVWFPLAQRWLGFDDARVVVDGDTRTFRAEILVDGPVDHLTGRYTTAGGVILTAIELHH